MTAVRIIGVGITRFRREPNTPVESLGADAAHRALEDAALTRDEVDAVFCGSVLQGPALGQRIAIARLGMRGLPVFNVENVCASSATAFHLATMAVAAGAFRRVLVIGAEKLSALSGALSVSSGSYYEDVGLVLPALYSFRADRYLELYGGSPDDFAEVAVKNRANGALADHPLQQSAVERDAVLASRPISDHLTLFQVCPNADGAAALVLSKESAVTRDQAARTVAIVGQGMRSGEAFGRERDVLTDWVTAEAAAEAYEQAGITPEQIDVAEVHDATTIGEILNLEALRLLPEGGGLSATLAGETGLAGRIPVNPDGGLIARGHPIGATGAAQLVELVRQIRGEAGARQVKEPRYGLAHVTGGGVFGIEIAAACHVTILASPSSPSPASTV